MAIVQISQITNRKGLAIDLPQLAGAELGWSTDTRQLYIGNGTLQDGAPVIGNTEILTEFSDILNISSSYTYKGTAAGYIVQTGPTQSTPVTQTLQSWLDQYASVKDFGAMGDGTTDDTAAINRALNQLYCQTIQSPSIRRSLFFPAGVYVVSNSINIPSYATLVGEGANNSIIQLVNGNTNGATCVAQTADNLQNTGAGIVTAPTNITIANLEFQSLDPIIDVFLIQSAKNCRFQNVSFIGGISSPDTDTPSTSTYGVACSSTASLIPNNIVFEACTFSNTTWGLQNAKTISGTITPCSAQGIVVNNSSFNTLYQGVKLIAASGAIPTGFRITNNVFDNVYAEGIVFGTTVTTVNLNATGYNIFYNVGNSNTTGTGTLTPGWSIINIYGNNVSIGDMFARNDTDSASYPRVNLNNSQSIVTTNGTQLALGNYIRQTALSANLTVGTGNIATTNQATAFKVDYVITTTSGNVRTGQLMVAGNVSNDSNVTSGSTSVALTGNSTPVVISWNNTGVANATMKYSISYFN